MIVKGDGFYGELLPLVNRLMRQYGISPQQRLRFTCVLYHRYCELIAVYDPAAGAPLRPYLVRCLDAAAAAFQEREAPALGKTFGRLSLRVVRGGASSRTRAEGSLVVVPVRLPALIAELPPLLRKVVIWRYYELRSYSEIAALLHVKPPVVGRLLRRALTALRRKVSRLP